MNEMTWIGMHVRHFKGGLYRIVDVLINADVNHEDYVVVYQSDADGKKYARRSLNFWTMVEHEGQEEPRFVEVKPHLSLP